MLSLHVLYYDPWKVIKGGHKIGPKLGDRHSWPDRNDLGLISTPVSNHDKELMMAALLAGRCRGRRYLILGKYGHVLIFGDNSTANKTKFLWIL